MSAADLPAASPTVPTRRVRPFYWSVRRELWENRAIWIAPLAAAGVVLAGVGWSARFLPRMLQVAQGVGPVAKKAAGTLGLPYDAGGAGVIFTAIVVGVFYVLGSLHGERRDRSVLFWKSLPVSDRTTVLSKAFVALVILPVVAAVLATATMALTAAWHEVVLTSSGMDPALLWAHVNLPLMLVMVPYGLVIVSLWLAPVAGWLMVISAWAKRMTFVWAVAPPAAIVLFEYLAFGTTRALAFISRRLGGGMAEAYSVDGHGKVPIIQFSQLHPLRPFANREMWWGVLVAVLLFAACVWLRRRRDPI